MKKRLRGAQQGGEADVGEIPTRRMGVLLEERGLLSEDKEEAQMLSEGLCIQGFRCLMVS